MGMAAGPNRGVKSDINVTPLVDVCLVLLIIFMVVTPMLQRGKDVKLPQAHEKKSKEAAKEDPLILSVTPDKKMYLEQDNYATEDKLEEAIRMKLEPAPNRRVLLKGDQSLTFEDVRKVMNVARKAGAKGIALGFEEIKDK